MATLIFSILALLLVLVFLGVHIAVALGVASALGVYLLLGSPDIALSVLSGTAYEALRRDCLLYTSPSPRDRQKSRMPSSA